MACRNIRSPRLVLCRDAVPSDTQLFELIAEGGVMPRAIEVEWDKIDITSPCDFWDGDEDWDGFDINPPPNIVFIPEKLHSEWKKTGYSTTGSEVEDDISDWLSDTFGFTHLGWSRMGDEWLPRKGDVIGDADFQIVY